MAVGNGLGLRTLARCGIGNNLEYPLQNKSGSRLKKDKKESWSKECTYGLGSGQVLRGSLGISAREGK